MLKLKLQYLATCCKEPHGKRPWYWERLKAGGHRDGRGWDGWMASLTQWTWVWTSSGSWWWTGRPGVLQSMGLQRVGHDLSNWTELNLLQYSGLEKSMDCVVRGVKKSRTGLSNSHFSQMSGAWKLGEFTFCIISGENTSSEAFQLYRNHVTIITRGQMSPTSTGAVWRWRSAGPSEQRKGFRFGPGTSEGLLTGPTRSWHGFGLACDIYINFNLWESEWFCEALFTLP